MNKKTDKLLELMKSGFSAILNDNLVGIYLHGSYAFGTYNENVSDLDFLMVVYRKLNLSDKEKILDYTVETLYDYAPSKGLECHILELANTLNSSYPMKFDLHFSDMYFNNYLTNKKDYIEMMTGVDDDLAAHIMITNLYGKVLIGQPITEVFGVVNDELYLNSILSDVENAKSDILMEPMYIVLNLCRVLAFKEDKQVLSKKGGGEWGKRNSSEKYQNLIKIALADYNGETIARDNYKNSELEDFADYMLNQIF